MSYHRELLQSSRHLLVCHFFCLEQLYGSISMATMKVSNKLISVPTRFIIAWHTGTLDCLWCCYRSRLLMSQYSSNCNQHTFAIGKLTANSQTENGFWRMDEWRGATGREVVQTQVIMKFWKKFSNARISTVWQYSVSDDALPWKRSAVLSLAFSRRTSQHIAHVNPFFF